MLCPLIEKSYIHRQTDGQPLRDRPCNNLCICGGKVDVFLNFNCRWPWVFSSTPRCPFQERTLRYHPDGTFLDIVYYHSWKTNVSKMTLRSSKWKDIINLLFKARYSKDGRMLELGQENIQWLPLLFQIFEIQSVLADVC